MLLNKRPFIHLYLALGSAIFLCHLGFQNLKTSKFWGIERYCTVVEFAKSTDMKIFRIRQLKIFGRENPSSLGKVPKQFWMEVKRGN